jgi:hypothetical protein
MKKSFLLYLDQYDNIKDYSREQKGELLELFFKCNMGEELTFDDPIIKIIFPFFKQVFDRDRGKYEEKCKKNKENQEKRWAKQNEK